MASTNPNTRNLSFTELVALATSVKADYINLLHTPGATQGDLNKASKEYKHLVKLLRARNTRLKSRPYETTTSR